MSSAIALVIHIRGSTLLPQPHEPDSFISCPFNNLIGIICASNPDQGSQRKIQEASLKAKYPAMRTGSFIKRCPCCWQCVG